MNHLKLTVVGLLALTTVASDAFAFGPPPHPPMGGGLPHFPMGGGGPVGNIAARGPAGNTFGNIAAGHVGQGLADPPDQADRNSGDAGGRGRSPR